MAWPTMVTDRNPEARKRTSAKQTVPLTHRGSVCFLLGDWFGFRRSAPPRCNANPVTARPVGRYLGLIFGDQGQVAPALALDAGTSHEGSGTVALHLVLRLPPANPARSDFAL
jgi:hypothetical protein